MKNLKSLVFNRATGRAQHSRKKEDMRESQFNTYVFWVTHHRYMFRNYLILLLRVKSEPICEGRIYIHPDTFADAVSSYLDTTGFCNFEFLMDEMREMVTIQFDTVLSEYDFNNNILNESIIVSFIDAFKKELEYKINRNEYLEWLENERYYL